MSKKGNRRSFLKSLKAELINGNKLSSKEQMKVKGIILKNSWWISR